MCALHSRGLHHFHFSVLFENIFNYRRLYCLWKFEKFMNPYYVYCAKQCVNVIKSPRRHRILHTFHKLIELTLTRGDYTLSNTTIQIHHHTHERPYQLHIIIRKEENYKFKMQETKIGQKKISFIIGQI